MPRYWILALGALVAAGALVSIDAWVMAATVKSPAVRRALLSGVDLQYVDQSVRPQDDLYRHLNGKWLDSFQIPADKGSYGSFTYLYDATQEQLRVIVDGLDGSGDAEARKIADLYASFMDESRLEALGLKPLQTEFAAIDAISDKKEIPALIAHLNRIGAGAPYAFSINQDARNSLQYAVIVRQSGLGMPDRDYYLKDDAKLKDTRAKYLVHIGKMLGMAGDADAQSHAAAILDLETALAQVQWTRVENRDPIKTYNKTAIAELPQLMPGYAWPEYLRASDIAGRVDSVIINQPSYFSGLDKLMRETPLPDWKAYFKWHVLSAAAPYMSKAFVDERFAFSGTVLSGIPENRDRWKRGVALIDDALGEALGKRYVAKYFPPQNKARMEALIANMLEAYRRDIDTLDWMSPETRKGAQAKLTKLVTKIGYPDTWRDYGALQISRDDLWGNVVRANEFEYRRNLNKLGKPVDRSEWGMTPQTINAYYNPLMNEIVFPAAILQPPFFNVQADDAVNYGGIVAVIGHEMSHGFDDRGSQYDADGNLRDWFTPEDHQKFKAKTRVLVAQYGTYEPVPGFPVNGELTLGENIGDNSGLAIAYKAYRLSLAGKTPPVIDGFTGEQRLYLGWVQVWRGKEREAEAIQRIKSDPHSPAAVRGTAPVVNQEGFYAAFGVKQGDKMYLPPEKRVNIW
ncbi:MAG TPA: M13-type metalloendopeptidase [Steroidobacteraceae bacterium]|jgi:predicted metalloendopeptidase|nr:M13-type metalloendopeptidase [Steroidobacteraceae bacterium]